MAPLLTHVQELFCLLSNSASHSREEQFPNGGSIHVQYAGIRANMMERHESRQSSICGRVDTVLSMYYVILYVTNVVAQAHPLYR